MTCDDFQRIVQDLSTSGCLVSNFEIVQPGTFAPAGASNAETALTHSCCFAAISGRYPVSSENGRGEGKGAEPACKPGSVVDSHSSGPPIAGRLKQPTRNRRGPRQWFPIWSCSRWGLPCRPVARLAVRSYRTISPLPTNPEEFVGGIFLLHFPSTRAAQALPGIVPCGARTFLGIVSDDATAWPTPPAYSTASPANTPQSLLRKRLGPKAQAATPPFVPAARIAP